MLQRCTNPKATKYPQYGAKGITVCDRWLQFSHFLEDMGERPPGRTLDRIDGTKGYCPENCRWASGKEQQRNIRFNRIVEYEGVRMPLAALAEKLGITDTTLSYRMKHWPPAQWGTPPNYGRRDRSIKP